MSSSPCPDWNDGWAWEETAVTGTLCVLSIQHPPGSQISQVQQDVRAAVVALMSGTAVQGWGHPLHGVGGSRKVTVLSLATVGFFKPLVCSRSCLLLTGRSRKPWAKMICWYKGSNSTWLRNPSSLLLSEEHCLHDHTQRKLNTFDISPCRLPTDTVSQDSFLPGSHGPPSCEYETKLVNNSADA